MQKLAVALITLQLLAGCAQSDQPPTDWCNGSRDVFRALAPGLHHALGNPAPAQAYSLVTLAPSSGMALDLPLPWSEAELGHVGYMFLPPTRYTDGTLFPNGLQGSINLRQQEGALVVQAQFPQGMPASERQATVVAFLANLTSADKATIQDVAADVVAHASEVSDGPGSGGGSMTSHADAPTPAAKGQVKLSLPLSPSSQLRTAFAGGSISAVSGGRQIVSDRWAFDANLPQRAARWDVGNVSFEVRADEGDRAEVAVFSPHHDEITGVRLREAALAMIGYNSTVNWHASHDASAPIESWRPVCRRA